MPKISATVITLNEEENIAKCLESLKSLVDEIILIDSGSKDRTVEIAKEFGARIYGRRFDDYKSQKNFALSKTSNDWILSVDADEVIPKALTDEIKEVLPETKFAGFLIPRRNFILGGEIKHSRWSPDKHIWVWRKSKGKWEGEVHEEVFVEGSVGELKNAKIHYQDKTIFSFISKNTRYAKLEAVKKYRAGQRFSIISFFWDPIFEFSVRYIYKKGYLDSWRGLVLVLFMAIYKIQVNLNLFFISSKK